MSWEPTRHGGWRRTGVAQIESASATRKRSKGRILPPVLIKWRERLGLPSCPYLIRWRIETRWGSIRLHHWLGPDDDRAWHDHPWDFWTVVLKGGYVDASPSGNEHLGQWQRRRRGAEHQHTVYPDPGGAWTLVVAGPRRRSWGFWRAADPRRFIRANKWFASRGHHPCA